MKNKSEVLKRLHENEKYKSALASVSTEAERKLIASITNEFVSSFADILIPLLVRAKKDPVFAEQLGRAINLRRDVVTSEPAISGSIG